LNKGIISCAPIAILTAQLIEGASSKRIDIGGSVNLGGGYESNILHHPEIMEPGTGQYKPVQDDAFISVAPWLYFLYAANRANKFQFSVNGDYDIFAQHTQVDGGWLKGGCAHGWHV